MGMFTEIFAWWTGTTIGTRFFTWRKGTFVGEDEFGTKYYQANVAPLGDRRWAVYVNDWEPSQVPPGWHAWLHHTVDVAPSQEDYVSREWQKAHRPNQTGTAGAYRPRGSTLASGQPGKIGNDYEAWSPGR